eukprot:365428-Chlamydomonas_euryale.AAC.1
MSGASIPPGAPRPPCPRPMPAGADDCGSTGELGRTPPTPPPAAASSPLPSSASPDADSPGVRGKNASDSAAAARV